MLFIILVLVLSIPYIQTLLGKYATNWVNEEFKTNINIDRVNLQFNGGIELKSIYIEDYKKDTLISAAEINTSILRFGHLYKGKLVFGDITIKNLLFNINTYKGETQTNLDMFVDRFKNDNPKTVKSKFLLSSSDVSIIDSEFKFSNDNLQNNKVLHFENLNINATNFLINGSNVNMRVNTLSFKDSRGLKVKNMVTDFAYTVTDMTFSNFKIKTPNSILKGDLKFSYKREDLKYFLDKVNVSGSFKDSYLQLDELNTFYNEFGANQSVRFSTNVLGTLNNLQTNNLKLNSNSKTRVYGNINFKNLFSNRADDFYMNGYFTDLSSTYKDLKGFLPNVLGAVIPTSFDRLGYFTISGNSQITTSEVIADIKINTALGFVDSNLEITKINNIDNAYYKGNVIFKSFDFGTFLNEAKIGKASLNINVDGKGFVAEKIETKVQGEIFELDYNSYNYQNVIVAGNVKNKIFDGNLNINDENLQLNFKGLVDFSEKIKKYDFEAEIDYANLKALNFIKNDSISVFQSKVKMNMNSSSFDDAYGKIEFNKTIYKNEHDTYYFDRFNISSRFKNDMRFVTFNSPDIVEGELKGRFFLKDLRKLFENSLGYIYTNYLPHKVNSKQVLDFNFKIYNKIIEVFFPEIEVGKNTFVRGRVESEEENFKLTFKSPEIKYLKDFAKNIELQVDNSNPLFNTYLEIDSLKTKFYNVSKFNLINVTVNDTLFMRSEFFGGNQNKDIYNLSFFHTINTKNESVVGFKRSDVTIKDHKWVINQSQDKLHKVAFNKKLTKFDFSPFKINHNEEEIKFSGFTRDSTEKSLKLNFKNVSLSKITPNIDSISLSGNVNGSLDVVQKNGNYLPNANINIDRFTINDFLLGTFDGTISGNESLTNYAVNAIIKNDLITAFGARGNIFVTDKEPTANLVLKFNDFNLAPLNPFLDGVLSDIRGYANGDVNVIGDLKKAAIFGDLIVEKGGFGIPYLNVDYTLNNKFSVVLKDQSFIFNNVKLTDTKYKSKGVLNGFIKHTNFSKWNLGLDVKTPRLLILDTKEVEESLYYGTGFLGGRASISGPTEQLAINVVGETKPGTVFKIPLSDAESFGDNSYINFITKAEKEAIKQGEYEFVDEIKGLELNFDLDVTEDAEVEIIIDKETGHALKGRGRGGILVEINTNGKFDMWGDFAVFEGVYNFAFGGLIQKEFIVKPGGTIAWEGDPLNAIIRMDAVYKTQANPSPLLDNPINRSIPVNLNIALAGNLEQFDPVFSFEFPNVNSAVKSELNYRLESKDERDTQALFLVSTGSFSRGLNNLNASGTIAERLNGILNGIFTTDNSKVNVGLNFEAGQNRPDYQTDDRFGVTLQTQISDRVLINGKVGVPVGGATETVIAGDVKIDFLLNEEGTLTAQVFNRENSIRNFGEQIGYTQGVGLAYNVDFDTFKELIRKVFKSSKKNKLKTENKENETENPLPDFIFVKPSSQE